MMGTPRKGDKVPFKTKNAFNSTNREKYVFHCSVSQIHINPKKKHEKNIKMTFCDIHINIIY